MADQVLLEQEARRVEDATRQSVREGRRVLGEILARPAMLKGADKAAALDFNARLTTLLRERDEQRGSGMRHRLWGL